ncbi:alpha/beta hydrolase-fold protein [Pedobacter duraquae]|uniref:Putative esterase n=1 Tax=Pedobacter duraquae TaxID=425511 RepID=A0A4V3C366_9SPHI|nr:alpha/beta hydrolase-fold protein [Pedobacter duraquae]TDO20889.1 putative esterase [Pedobacter duraquae]
MKRTALLIALQILFYCTLQLHAQEKTVNLFDSAGTYYQKRDFKKAAYFYDTYYLIQKNTQSNYDTYRAAVSSSHIGNIENAKYYLTRSGQIGYDYSGFYEYPSYDKFVNDPIHIPLKNLPEWKSFITTLKYKADSATIAVRKIIAELEDTTGRINRPVIYNNSYWQQTAKTLSAAELSKKIKTFNTFSKPLKTGFWTLYKIKVSDTLTVPFMVYIPKGYNPGQSTPLYIYLHGAIINRKDFANPAWIERGQEIKIVEKAQTNNAFIIYPFGRKDFGWLYHQKAFETIVSELGMVKSMYNIDDNKVYVMGHSNGGSGAYWFAVNHPTPFAAFVGLNYLPKVYAGNTSLRNMENATPFYGISGSKDNNFPLLLINGMYTYAKTNGANWTNYTRQGEHTLAVFQRDSINFIFDTLSKTKRDPLPKKLQWETDNIKNGRNGWLEILELDTLKPRADWQQPLNPTVTQNGKTGTIDFNKNRSGAVKVQADGNNISVETSRVKRIKLYISADLFDLKRQIMITINKKQHLNFMLTEDKRTILTEFLRTKDRAFIVSNTIEFTIE